MWPDKRVLAWCEECGALVQHENGKVDVVCVANKYEDIVQENGSDWAEWVEAELVEE